MKSKKEKTIIITEEIENLIIKKQITLQHDIVYNKKTIINKLVNIKQRKKVVIYDITFLEKKKTHKQIQISNHINKTGENPLRAKQQKLKIDFIDITTIYKHKQKEKTITTSLGKRYKTNKKKVKTPSTYMSNIATICKALKFSEIEGRLINKKTKL